MSPDPDTKPRHKEETCGHCGKESSQFFICNFCWQQGCPHCMSGGAHFACRQNQRNLDRDRIFLRGFQEAFPCITVIIVDGGPIGGEGLITAR
ncbi:hypothetical protein A3H19_05470 [Candidatus Woesebacteria bacterium RIFCSPLOWO2_12_FULL_39_9]|nr:MAG: hypothetical protein A3H19_05470 [Candidatus Woesebacteria bacterium RIFCSPLOWO2_12_FULL_39_9]